MSYARWGEGSDVYVYAHVDGFVECCGCALEGDSVSLHSPAEVVDHMRDHFKAGHDVPARLLNPDLYEPEVFAPRCAAFHCYKRAGHDGGHSPHRWGSPLYVTTLFRCPCGKPESDPIHRTRKPER